MSVITTPVQRCVLCKGETRAGTTELRFEFGDVSVIVEGVPAQFCDDCGEEYIYGPLGRLIGNGAADIATAIREQRAFQGSTLHTHVDKMELQLAHA